VKIQISVQWARWAEANSKQAEANSKHTWSDSKAETQNGKTVTQNEFEESRNPTRSAEKLYGRRSESNCQENIPTSCNEGQKSETGMGVLHVHLPVIMSR